MPAPNYIPRQADIDTLFEAITGSHCASIIGLSNMGKSTLLRAMRDVEIANRYYAETGRRAQFVYADCNRMLDLSAQGLYELILKAIIEAVPDFDADVQSEIELGYQNITRPASDFDIPLNFNNAMTAILERGGRDIILMLDEFDESFAALEGRVFLNLRALWDRFRHNLVYVTANVRHLGTFRTASDSAEFVELSAAHTIVLHPFEADDARRAILAVVESAGQKLTDDEVDLLLEESGGHPGLIKTVARAYLRQPQDVRRGTADAVRHVMDNDKSILSECSGIWRQLLLEEQEYCFVFLGGGHDTLSEVVLRPLREWGLLRGGPPALFSAVFERFLRRQTIHSTDVPGGLVIDPDAGDVWLDSQLVPPLTDLEFRMLLLLYERQGKVTDKYQIVETVWGEQFIDEVEDSRIEKLVSRLRVKIEPDPGNPHYLTTVRGRGYKLTLS